MNILESTIQKITGQDGNARQRARARLEQLIMPRWALGRLGDPRYPVDVPHWQAELGQVSRTFTLPAGYFCYVPAGA
ncbi:MAG: nicotinate-nucleotide--dimethylbenzimidazole phosphoribosyltransferase, partial [Syntrophaceae bacterium]|nr:nicotinate-nucleotide--dimethylbenzimidazole phosphoribosyltransferase [Syntrophaceae bacterium]